MQSSEKVEGSLYSGLLIHELATKQFCNKSLHGGTRRFKELFRVKIKSGNN